MKHSTTYPFRRWYRKPLTPRESAVIGLLERRRRRTGRVCIVLTVSAAEHAAISRLLLHYALFLNNRCSLSCIIQVATTPNSTLLTPHCSACQQVLEEDVSVVNPMISSALCCVHGVRGSPLHGKLGELASITPHFSLLTPHSSLLTDKYNRTCRPYYFERITVFSYLCTEHN